MKWRERDRDRDRDRDRSLLCVPFEVSGTAMQSERSSDRDETRGRGRWNGEWQQQRIVTGLPPPRDEQAAAGGLRCRHAGLPLEALDLHVQFSFPRCGSDDQLRAAK